MPPVKNDIHHNFADSGLVMSGYADYTSVFMVKIFGIAGLGLMGGSFAKAIRASVPDAVVFALDSDQTALDTAGKAGIVDGVFAPEDAPDMLSRCDIVFVCLYPQSSIQFLSEHRAHFKSGSVVTDISGVKTAMVGALPQILREDVDFICGHPMAGSEKEGFAHADAGIFSGRNYILMPLPSNKPENIRQFKALITALGFGRITETDFAAHDHKIAFTSQLCHVIASALVDSAEDTEITAFGGGSYEDLTRIAMINVPLWTELFLANKKELLSHIDFFEASLQNIKQAIKTDDSEALRSILGRVREKRTVMGSRQDAAGKGVVP